MIVDSMPTQHAKWIKECQRADMATPIPSLNYLLTVTCGATITTDLAIKAPALSITIVSQEERNRDAFIFRPTETA